MTTQPNTAHPLSSVRAGLLLGLAALMATGPTFAQGGPQRDEQQQAQRQPSRQDNDKGSSKGPDQASDRGGHDEQRGNSNDRRDSRPTNAAKQNDRAAGPRYDFGQNDRSRLQTHYRSSLGKVDRDKRPSFQAGHEIPRAYRSAITPAPESLRRRLPTPPSGYQIGYYQGYTVVYDPTTYVILTLIDLLS